MFAAAVPNNWERVLRELVQGAPGPHAGGRAPSQLRRSLLAGVCLFNLVVNSDAIRGVCKPPACLPSAVPQRCMPTMLR